MNLAKGLSIKDSKKVGVLVDILVLVVPVQSEGNIQL